MKRPLLIKIHLVLASLFMPFLLLMPLTGVCYLLGFKGSEIKTEVFRLTAAIPDQPEERKTFFQEQFRAQNLDYSFQEIKENATEIFFRPTSRVYYSVTKGPELIFSKVEPDLLRRLIEIHKGHGPQLMRYFEMAFGLALILTTLSGLWLSLTVPAYRKITWVSFALGLGVIVLGLF